MVSIHESYRNCIFAIFLSSHEAESFSGMKFREALQGPHMAEYARYP